MGRPLNRPRADAVAYHGEVWTDSRGYATVRLPAGAAALELPLEYELRDLDPPSRAQISAGLEHGHFTIATDEPHVKVAWRIVGRRAAEGGRQQPVEEEDDKR
jgi:hypothetical protein